MLAVSLPVGSSPLITLDLPSVLGPRVLNALKADPRTIDIRALAPHYYALGSLMLELFDEEEIVDVMSAVSIILSRAFLVAELYSDLQETSCRGCRPGT